MNREAEDAPAPRQIDDLNALIEVLNLQTVKFYELYAVVDDEAEPADEDQPISVRTALRKRPAGIDYRVEFEVRRPNGAIRADAAAVYSAEAPIDATDEVLLDFGDMVAMMTIVPYLRQAVSDLAQRLGDHVVVPMLPRGALSFRPTANPLVDDEAADGATHESDSQLGAWVSSWCPVVAAPGESLALVGEFCENAVWTIRVSYST